MAMTHRQRLVTALSHQEPDMVPIDLASTIDSSIVVEGYERLKVYFGVESENVLTNRMMRVVDVDEPVLQALDIDTRGVFPAGPPDQIIGEDRYRDEWGVERIRPPGSYYYDERTFPLAGEITFSDVARYPMPDPDDPVRIKGLKERVDQIHRADLFIFCNRERTLVKMVTWEGNGFVLWMKRLEKSRFKWPLSDSCAVVSLTVTEINWLLDGYPLTVTRAIRAVI